MADSWPHAIEALRAADASLSRLAPGDLTEMERRLEQRRAALERVSTLAAHSPLDAGAEGLRALDESAAGAAALRTRLLVERASLRESMASSQHLRSLSRALAPDQPPSGQRFRRSA